MSRAVFLLSIVVAASAVAGDVRPKGTAPLRHSTAVALNQSVATTCQEEDNVNVPIVLDNSGRARPFEIVATQPLYQLVPGDENCPPDFSGCSTSQQRTATAAVSAVTTVFDDGITVVTVSVIDDWWRPESTLVVTPRGMARGQLIQFHRKIVDVDSWPVVMAIYEDGNVRVKPHPPIQLPDNCFGSSVVIGSAMISQRPFIDVSAVYVVPTDSVIQLVLVYKTGGFAYLRLAVDREAATLKVEPFYGVNSQIPFATFRSMWVEDGKADVDHVQTATSDVPILDWNELQGSWWLFYRSVRSTHNPSSPDIRVSIR